MITLTHVSKIFPGGESGVHAVQDVSLHIAPGEIFGIIGYSGAGKSTLVRCINLLERPTQGTVTVDGRELTALSEKELRQERRKIGMIFQQFNLMTARTVAQNVAFPLKDSGLSKEETAAKVTQLLELVGLPDKAGSYPAQLSGGQKQRVAIARALASDPKVLLCDEATSALDPQTTASILRLIRDINRRTGITVVVITHEMAVVKEICHRVAVMEKGRVVETGDVFSLFSAPKEPVTRSFVSTTSNLSKAEEFIAEGAPLVALSPGQVIARLTFARGNVGEAAISQLSRQFDVDANIIFANVDILEGTPLGGLVVIFSGERVGEAIAWLSEKNVVVEVLKRG
ncbi:MAG: methionine ABC transporter ATP-binding protein [Oscillospiraceae bacterium]|jgi:D-methionine transport system ATP-binding protein|nr:methionine ABC transporter ATP-binding protein [Oscillospiraceae bacterium]